MVDEWKEFVRGEYTPKQIIEQSINALNATIDRLDKIINEMQDNCQCKK
jgi:hypothetical protein